MAQSLTMKGKSRESSSSRVWAPCAKDSEEAVGAARCDMGGTMSGTPVRELRVQLEKRQVRDAMQVSAGGVVSVGQVQLAALVE